MRLTSALISIAGVFTVCWSLTLPAYKNKRAYESAYDSIDASSPEASKQFWELRNSSLTEKNQIQDYGIVILSVGVVGVCLFTKRGWRISSPRTRKQIVGLGFVCVTVTAISLFASMFLALSRGEYPHWSDSAGLGIAQIIMFILVLLVWMAPHLLFLRGRFKTHQKLVFTPSISTSPLLVEGTLLFCCSILSMIQADILAASFLLWAYFCFSLMAGKV